MAESSSIEAANLKIGPNIIAQKNDRTGHSPIYQKKSASRKKWAVEADQRLRILRAKNEDMPWLEFGERFPFPGRTWQAVRERYRTLTKPCEILQRHSSVSASEDDWEDDWEIPSGATPNPANSLKRTCRRQSSSEENAPKRMLLRPSRPSLKELQPEIPTRSPEAASVSGHSPSGIASATHDLASTCDNGNKPKEDSDIKLVRQLFGPKHWALIVEEARKRETERKEAETVRSENLTLKAELKELKEQNTRFQKMEEIQRLISEVTKSGGKQNPLDSAGNGIADGY